MAHAHDFVSARELLEAHRLVISEEAFWDVIDELGPIEHETQDSFDSFAFCMPPRVAVNAQNHDRNYEHLDVAFGRETRLFSMVLDQDGWVVLATGDWRWVRMREPFDLEVQESGFVLWSASDWRHMFTRPEGDKVWIKGYVSPEAAERDAVEAGVPIAGYVDPSQFPLLAEGWSKQPVPAATTLIAI